MTEQTPVEQPTQTFVGVSVVKPKQNPMFDEFQHAITRFLTYGKKVKCAHCGKMRKKHWTQLVFFRVIEEEAGFVLKESETEYPPLTPVCDDHILAPADQSA